MVSKKKSTSAGTNKQSAQGKAVGKGASKPQPVPAAGKTGAGKPGSGRIGAGKVGANKNGKKAAASVVTAAGNKSAATPKAAAAGKNQKTVGIPSDRIVGRPEALKGVSNDGKRVPVAAEPVPERQQAASDNDKERPLRKTWLKDKDLSYFKELLLRKRSELVGDMEGMSKEALSKNRSESTGDVSSMPTHMADLGSDNWEQEFTLGLIATERTLLREIDEALDRIKNRTYGICLATNQRISKARLQAKPWAKYCIEYARKRELGLVP